MIPLIVNRAELAMLDGWVREVATEVLTAAGVDLHYTVGTMIETPRAALDAQAIARGRGVLLVRHQRPHADGVRLLARRRREPPDAARTSRRSCCAISPFEEIDVDGVGRLVEIAVAEGRATRPDIKLGICGEHGGNPASVQFCVEVGLDYVSCSPYRVPIARLAAAHAALGAGGPGGTA